MVRLRSVPAVLTVLVALALLFTGVSPAAEPLRVCAPVPELGSLAEELPADRVIAVGSSRTLAR